MVVHLNTLVAAARSSAALMRFWCASFMFKSGCWNSLGKEGYLCRTGSLDMLAKVDGTSYGGNYVWRSPQFYSAAGSYEFGCNRRGREKSICGGGNKGSTVKSRSGVCYGSCDVGGLNLCRHVRATISKVFSSRSYIARTFSISSSALSAKTTDTETINRRRQRGGLRRMICLVNAAPISAMRSLPTSIRYTSFTSTPLAGRLDRLSASKSPISPLTTVSLSLVDKKTDANPSLQATPSQGVAAPSASAADPAVLVSPKNVKVFEGHFCALLYRNLCNRLKAVALEAKAAAEMQVPVVVGRGVTAGSSRNGKMYDMGRGTGSVEHRRRSAQQLPSAGDHKSEEVTVMKNAECISRGCTGNSSTCGWNSVYSDSSYPITKWTHRYHHYTD